jgi:hypothetical protein
MQYVNMHDVVFDGEAMGFPSLMGCHGIVYSTEVGMYGYHNYGGSATAKFKVRAELFADFVNTHFLHGATGLHLYGCAFVGRRGYDPVAAESWKAELKAFAKALGFKGPISGYNLDAHPAWASAYAEYRFHQGATSLYVEDWANKQAAWGTNTYRSNHRRIVDGVRNSAPVQIVEGVDDIITGPAPANLLAVVPQPF